MKYKSFIGGLGITLLFMIVCGCGVKEASTKTMPSSQPQKKQQSTEPMSTVSTKVETQEKDRQEEVDYTQIYTPILEEFYTFIANGLDDEVVDEGKTGVMEAIMGQEKEVALGSVGYSIQDISGDKVPELVIGAITESKDFIGYGKEIYAVYTCVKDVPHYVFEGRSRSRYFIMNQGKFFYQGANGAMYSIFGTYTMTLDGTALSCKDYYFTFEKNESFTEMGFYHNHSGVWDKVVSEELKISDEAFWQIEAALENQTQLMELIPFSEYKRSDEKTQTTYDAKIQIRMQWAKEVQADLSDYDTFIVDTTESQSKIVFSAGKRVKDFKVLALSMADVDEDGKIRFTVKELYALDQLTPERPLVVGLTFYGDLPHYGISYVDENGITRQFAIQISGKDGSLLLDAIF